MAIESSNRSPSPMSFRQNPNPNFTNSRNRDGGIRRSSSGGSPFPRPSVVAHPSAWCSNSKTASANTPLDLAKRNSFSKESATLRLSQDSNEHKENKKPNPISKPVRGTKNFMAPTISAVSKATPSPRKKALGERNEAVRTSASLSDGKFLFFGVLDEDENCERKEETHVSICEPKKKVTFDDHVVVLSPEVICDFDADEPFSVKSFNFSENEQNEPTTPLFSSPLPIAPLDADPFLPSYDPNTNFLSPRPQFLRYNPNRKVSVEDSLSSEISSDNDMESTVGSVQEEESLGSFSSSSVGEELKHESSGDSVQTHEEISDESEIVDLQEEESSDERESVSEPRFFTKWRTIAWILVFGAVAVLSSMIVIHAPPESTLSKVYQYNHPLFSDSLHRMSEFSSKYLPLMLSSFSETDTTEFMPSQFLNFSALVCDANDHFVENEASGFPAVPETKILPDQQVQYLVENSMSELGANHEEVEVQTKLQVAEAELLKPDHPEMEQLTAIYGTSLQIYVESQPDSNAKEQPVIEDVISEQIVSEDVASEQPASEEVASEQPASEELAFEQPASDELASEQPAREELASEQPAASEGIASEQTQFIEQTAVDVLEETSSYNTVAESGNATVLVVSLCVATYFGILALIVMYKYSTGQAEMLIQKEEESFHENPSPESRSKAGEEMDAETYSGMSCSYSMYDNKRELRGAESEAQSRERKQQPKRNYKRESLASSSSEYTKESASYGSFTTYSIRPVKNGDEEIVTPVRRSSRLRQQP